MNLYIKFYIIFSWCNSVTKSYWATFVWDSRLQLSIYLRKLCLPDFCHNRLDSWQSKYYCSYGRKQWGLLYVAGSSFRYFKSWISGEKKNRNRSFRRRAKTKHQTKKTRNFWSHLIMQTKTVTRVVKQDIQDMKH